jgi:hypothetical protein
MILTALERAEHRIYELPVVEAFIARRESGDERIDDQETIDAVASEMLEHQSSDGSWGGSVVLTAEALLLLYELDMPVSMRTVVERAQHWLRGRRNVEGAYTQGCSPERHELALCEHFAGGFFAPASYSVDLTGASLTNGLTFQTDTDARLGISALALHAMRRWSRASIDDSLHLAALHRIVTAAARGYIPEIPLHTMTLVLTALALGPRTPEFISVLHGSLTKITGYQRADGSWQGAEPFHVADLYLYATKAGYGSPVFDAAIVRTAELLVHTQNPDGSWGQDTTGPYRLLTGWRTLRYAARLVE